MGQKGMGTSGVGFSAAPVRKRNVNISEMLDSRQNAVRFLLLEALADARNPLGTEQIERACGGLSFPVDEVLRQLEEKGVIVRDEKKAVVAAYPVSAVPTRHRVVLEDGRTLHAMCAIDAIGAAFAFDQDAEVQSSCLHCDTAVRLRLANGRLREAEPGSVQVLHADLTKYRNWAADC